MLDVYRSLSAPAVLLMTVGQGVFRGLQNMRVPLMITLATNMVHLALDSLLMFHLHMGLKGAAVSTTISEWLAAACYCQLMWRKRAVLGLWPPLSMTVAGAGSRYMPFLKVSTRFTSCLHVITHVCDLVNHIDLSSMAVQQQCSP